MLNNTPYLWKDVSPSQLINRYNVYLFPEENVFLYLDGQVVDLGSLPLHDTLPTTTSSQVSHPPLSPDAFFSLCASSPLLLPSSFTEWLFFLFPCAFFHPGVVPAADVSIDFF